MHGDYGHFDLMLPYVRSINQHINGHFDSIHIKFRFINQYTNKHKCNELIMQNDIRPRNMGKKLVHNVSKHILSSFHF